LVAGCALWIAGCEQKELRAKGIVHRVRHRSAEAAGRSKGFQILGEKGIGLKAQGMVKNSEIGMRKSEKELWIVDLERG